ncbi:lactonase family protein [Mongoliitalea lutea]|uniref:3-carboxymuconate cyclase n=1 Tax=Mongoliitalea lutea TaxID=849756 RepID=A0A8J3G4M4_9BACT|nr:lactonase family protein [Mongoliitalea lutea]GHB29068.1 3-carboxymuconate cyclase [Mongoliitalea lutea]
MKQRIKYIIISVLIFSSLSSCDETPQEGTLKPTYSFLVGSYTDGIEHGIGVLSFNFEEGVLGMNPLKVGVENPSFVIANRAQDLVFAVEETNEGKIKSYAFDRATNTLTLIDEQPTFGAHPCYIALSPDEHIVVVGNYSGGNFSVYKVDEGKLTHVQTVQHEGSSINSARQNQSHVHSVVFHPEGKYLLVGDLGTDKVFVYNYRPDYAVPFQPFSQPHFEVEAGVGPRHLIVHPSGRFVYLVHELSAEIGVYKFQNGRLSHIDSYPLTASTYVGAISAAEVRISPENNFLYVSNRGDANELSSFQIQEDGTLALVERISTGGITPRNFTLTKDGNYLLVAHQDSGDIQVFERNNKTGKLTKTTMEIKVNSPVYLFSLDG